MLNKIKFKYVPIGAYLTDVPHKNPHKYRKATKTTVECIVHNHPTLLAYLPDSDCYSDYEVIPFSEVQIGEECWWIHSELGVCPWYRDPLFSSDKWEQKYKKTSYQEGLCCQTGKAGIFQSYASVVVALPRPSSPQSNPESWRKPENICHLRELKVGDRCLIQAPLVHAYARPLTIKEFRDEIYAGNTVSKLVILENEFHQKYFMQSTHQVWKEPKEPPKRPKLMLSQLAPGTHFEFVGHKKELIKMQSLSANGEMYYRDFYDNVYCLQKHMDREVVEAIPF